MRSKTHVFRDLADTTDLTDVTGTLSPAALSDPASARGTDWTVRSLGTLGRERFAEAMLRASQGDPYETSTADSALEDLRDLEEAAGAAFDAENWVVVDDAQGEIGVVLPQIYAQDPTAGTLFYLAVVPERRGSGLGRRLHAFGLRRLRQLGAVHYYGSTDSRNAPMLAIFTANGCTARPE